MRLKCEVWLRQVVGPKRGGGSLCCICVLMSELFEIFAVLTCCAMWVGLSMPFKNGVSALSSRTILRHFSLED